MFMLYHNFIYLSNLFSSPLLHSSILLYTMANSKKQPLQSGKHDSGHHPEESVPLSSGSLTRSNNRTREKKISPRDTISYAASMTHQPGKPPSTWPFLWPPSKKTKSTVFTPLKKRISIKVEFTNFHKLSYYSEIRLYFTFWEQQNTNTR